MRLKHVYIENYKNLKQFSVDFENDDLIEIFVGKNASGKSNFLEALTLIFQCLYTSKKKNFFFIFEFEIIYEINGEITEIKVSDGSLIINQKPRLKLGKTPLPENVMIYYSGQNNTITDLVNQYEKSFKDKIKGAEVEDSREFLGIGPEYKEILLSLLLLQSCQCCAKQFIINKLLLTDSNYEFTLNLKRPPFATGRFKELNRTASTVIDKVDDFDPRTHFWGAVGITKTFIDKLLKCIKGEYMHRDIYNSQTDSYEFKVSSDLYQEEFNDSTLIEQFKMFDNLKVLGMLVSINTKVTTINYQSCDLNSFSDGQFQSVYIFAISEIFKSVECLTLLDEPDAFLHPEWQFEYLKQVLQISDQASRTNHIIMSSHSASTIISAEESTINLLDFDDERVVINKVKKSDVIESLSAGLITLTESEAELNINHVLKNSTKPVLFTEGITDEIILEKAWDKLYPTKKRNFEIQNAFSCGFLRNLINDKDKDLYSSNPGRVFFALFDFDSAYKDWNQLGSIILNDPHNCLVKKLKDHEAYSMLLPVPNVSPIKDQVINIDTGNNYGDKSLLTIELLFYGIPSLDHYFVQDLSRTDKFFKFIGDSKKVFFAETEVPKLASEHFEIFRPIFDFIQTKI